MWRSYKTFTKDEILKPLINRKFLNLFEMANKHRCKGVGMKFWMKDWPENSYVTLTKVEFITPRKGRAWGLGTWEGVDKGEIEVQDALKLKQWRYEKPSGRDYHIS